MSLRPPSWLAGDAQAGSASQNAGLNLLDHELAGEKAAALGRAGERAERALARLHEAGDGAERSALLKAAAEAVHAYFIQRELCGMRRHDDAIRDYSIPRAVLLRLGAS